MKTLSTSLLAALCCQSALAASSEPLTTVVVTATRTAQTVDQSLAAVSVIERRDIEQLQATTLLDVLRQSPAISITNTGGIGKSSSVFLRGAASKNLLVLVDGVRIGSATLGQVSFESINLDQVERIEIVRGPRASLYGADAAAGVIQIFTRKGGQGLQPSLALSTGSDQTRRGQLTINGGDRQLWYSVGASVLRTDGFDAKQGSEPDKDGYRSKGGHLRLGKRFAPGHTLEGFFTLDNAENQYDGWTNYAETRNRVLGVKSRLNLTEHWQMSLLAGRSWDKSYSYKDTDPSSDFITRRDSFSLQNDISLADQLLVVGLDAQRDKVTSSNDYGEDSRTNKALFGQYLLPLGNADLEMSARLDDNEQFGSHSTGGIAWGMDLNPALRLTASYATAFKAPSFNDLYYPGSGDPSLNPEESNTLELGLKGRQGAFNWQAILFQSRYDDLIAWAPGADGKWRPANIDQARIRGLELQGDYLLHGWQLAANLTLLDPENRSGANRGQRLQRRASQIINLSADRQFADWSFGMSLYGQNRSYSDAANSRYLSGFATLDLRAAYALGKDWQVQAKVSNLLDKTYQTVAGYNQAGQAWQLGLVYQPR